MNNEINAAKDYRNQLINQAKLDAEETIRAYETEQKEKLEADKEKLNVAKNQFDQMDADFQKEVEQMKGLYRKNKDSVIDFIIGETLNVNMNLPDSYRKDKLNQKVVKRDDDL